ncbi:hypothetical protein LY625_01990 [Lysobacter sp. GX 14042]|uniref:hypothetical protein n=1 Tax=Lysobacter sp. GX 14042 TaxID=2907155 RepID=UPI001F45A2CF|nr:hypothetical protein [Lysobacter sp. GX 14042]MCE7031406.1 hypothetical protein [Lysobacter sp. GX 14042]
MPTADAYIQALQRRMRLHAYRTRGAGDMPPGWDEWFRQPPPPPEAAAHVEAIVAELAARPPRAPGPAVGDPGPWRAFAALWRQHWEPEDPEDRPLRVFAGGFSVLWHLLLFFALLWLLLTGISPGDAARQGEEDVVQVQFIGEGTPDEVGGGAGDTAAPVPMPDPAPVTAPAAPAATAVPATAATPALAEPAPAAEAGLPAPAFEVRPATGQPELPASIAAPAEREVPMPQPVEQRLQVTEPVSEDTTADFLLPPPSLDVHRALATPELQAPARNAAEREIPAPPRRLEPARVAAPELAGPMLQLPSRTPGERELPMPVTTPLPPAPELRRPAPAAPQPSLDPAERVARERAIPMPERPAAPAGQAPADPAVHVAAASDTAAAPPAVAGRAPDIAGDAPPAGEAGQASSAEANAPAAATTAGPRPTPAPGGWPDPGRADDWGGADTARDGGQAGQPAGLFDSDGRVRLADTPGSSATGNAPGTITEEIENLDRAGTWLRRPPTDYEPTSFDRFWQPNETLLEEWVRRSVTTVRIPIPGTSKTIVCQTVMLALGGGCGIEDPNMVEQPASARPPPDIPFKPELQEGGGTGG